MLMLIAVKERWNLHVKDRGLTNWMYTGHWYDCYHCFISITFVTFKLYKSLLNTVITCRTKLLNADWLSTPALNWLSASNRV